MYLSVKDVWLFYNRQFSSSQYKVKLKVFAFHNWENFPDYVLIVVQRFCYL